MDDFTWNRLDEDADAPLMERRRHPRVPAGGPARLSWSGAATGFQLEPGRLKDRSPAGCGVDSRVPIPERLQVLVDEESGAERWGEVRYCRPSEHGYRSGIEYRPQTLEFIDD